MNSIVVSKPDLLTFTQPFFKRSLQVNSLQPYNLQKVPFRTELLVIVQVTSNLGLLWDKSRIVMKNKQVVAILPWQPNSKILSEVYDSYAPALYKCILKFIPNQKLADIVLIESFVKIHGDLHLYKEPKEKSFPWMLRIVLHQCKVHCHLTNAVILNSLITSSTANSNE